MTLTPKRWAFIHEYLIDLNGTQAAIRAGFAAGTANREAARLLSNAVIRVEINKALEARAEQTSLKGKDVVEELRKIAFASIQADSKVSSKEGGTTKTIAVKVCDKIRALELLGKHLGMFSERHVHEGGDRPILFELGARDDAERLAAAQAALAAGRKALSIPSG